MAPAAQDASHLANPLATIEQLASSASQLDGIPADLEDSIRYASARLTQTAGILLRLPQDIIAQAIVLFTRFWVGAEGGSLREHGSRNVSAASLYLVAKLSALPKSPRSVLNVYTYLESFGSTFVDAARYFELNDPESYHLSEGSYQTQRNQLMRDEAHILRVLGFQTHVALPYTLCVNYIQALDVMSNPLSRQLAKRAFAHLNTALLSPQLLYLTHQPHALATAAIYLAARETDVKLPGEEWWEVFDTDREELGFVVVAMRSMEGYALEEKHRWGKKKVPMTVNEVEGELESRKILNGDGSG